MLLAKRQTVTVLFVVWCIAFGVAIAAPQRVAAQDKSPRGLMNTFSAAADASAREAALDAVIATGDETVIKSISKMIEDKLKGQEKKYADLLAPKIRAAYLKKVTELTDDQVLHIVKTRRLWKNYLLHGGDRENFREEYLKPVWEMKNFLLPRIEDIDDEQIKTIRAELVEFGEYQAKCNKALGVKPDPTVGKKSPTGIEYAPLDQPPTFLDNLRHLERSLRLGHSVASAGGRKVLMMNDKAAREIDVQEAEFVMFCNEVRMLMGTIAWRVDPLACAVTRDHSNDRTLGKASGHMSTVPGKRGFTHRNKRMGAPFHNSEGAGGGKDGRSYANGLSYGGGHTGPLYSLKRNSVGVGRRKGAFTSQYRYDRSIVHPCPVTSDELWMPPGVEANDIRSANMKRAYLAIKAGAFGPAMKSLAQTEPDIDLDKVLRRFFVLAIETEVEHLVRSIAEIEKTGDLYAAALRLAEARKMLDGIEGLDEKLADVTSRLSDKQHRDTLKAGELFYRVINSSQSKESQVRLMSQLRRRYKDTEYGRAIQAVIDAKDEKLNWHGYFIQKNSSVTSYDYPPKTK